MGSQSGMQGKHAQDKGACPCCRMGQTFQSGKRCVSNWNALPPWFNHAPLAAGEVIDSIARAGLQEPSCNYRPQRAAQTVAPGKRIFEEKLPAETPSQQPTYHQPEPTPSAAGFL